MIRADWGSVTIAEYDALAIIRREDSADVLNAYWVRTWQTGLASDVPTTVSDYGREWLTAAHLTYMTTGDEHELIRLAREFVCSFGTLTTISAARDARRVSA